MHLTDSNPLPPPPQPFTGALQYVGANIEDGFLVGLSLAEGSGVSHRVLHAATEHLLYVPAVCGEGGVRYWNDLDRGGVTTTTSRAASPVDQEAAAAAAEEKARRLTSSFVALGLVDEQRDW
jgi:hypothetical protein